MKMSRVPSRWASHSLMPHWLWFHAGKQYCSGHLPEASGMHWFLQSGHGEVELLSQRLCASSTLINTSKCSQNSCTDLFFPNQSSCFPTPTNMWNHHTFTVSQSKRWKLLSHEFKFPWTLLMFTLAGEFPLLWIPQTYPGPYVVSF